MADYDIGAAFSAIEDELISSMIRNLKRHKVEEITEGMQWSQWQVEQLKALEEYKQKAAQKYGAEFSSINDKIEESIRTSYNDGATEQERNILRAVQQGTSSNTSFTGSASVTGEFFKTNDRKLDALIKATTSDMQRAETAVLRMADDKYRKIIFNAQVYANTGAGTYAKAVDMATKDFLSAGINCIEYKNGRRVNIKSYADMAIRTANKRAYLQGEGAMRQEWGVHTVILNKRGNACPLCLPFVGKVFIDDVWSGGTAEEAKEKGYPLLSEAIAQGLYHPNCRDSHTTYFEGINTPPNEKENSSENIENAEGESSEKSEKEPLTEEEKQQAQELYNAEQKQQYAERQAERMERMSKYSLDEDNKRVYGNRAEIWRDKAEQAHKEVVNLEKNIPKDRTAQTLSQKNGLAKAVENLNNVVKSTKPSIYHINGIAGSELLSSTAQTLDRVSQSNDITDYSYSPEQKEENNKEKFVKDVAKSAESDIIIIKEISQPLVITKAQLGKKIGRHISEWGLNPQKREDREQFANIINDIVVNHDQPIRIGEWRGQEDDVLFFIKGGDVVITKKNGEFVTIMKGGVNNGRVKDAREF